MREAFDQNSNSILLAVKLNNCIQVQNRLQLLQIAHSIVDRINIHSIMVRELGDIIRAVH
jgi:hypothetical protein